MTLYQATTSYFCAGLIVDKSNKIIEAAPIIRWSVGKYLQEFVYWLDTRQGFLTKVCDE